MDDGWLNGGWVNGWRDVAGAVVRELLVIETTFELRMPDEKELGMRMPGKESQVGKLQE